MSTRATNNSELPSGDAASSHRSVTGVGVDGTVSASAALTPYLLAPVEPAAVEVGCGQAPEVFSNGGRVAGDCSAISCGVNRIAGGWEAPSELNADLETGVTGGESAALNSQLTPSCDVRAAAAAEINVSGDSSPMHDERTWEQRRALTNGDSLVLEPTLTGRGPCDSGALNFDDEVSELEAAWLRAGIISNSIALRSFALNLISASAVQFSSVSSVTGV